MSTEQPATEGPKTLSFDKKYTYFDLESFEQKKVAVTVGFTPAVTYQEAVERLGNDENEVLEALNAYLQRQTLLEARNTATAGGASKSVVLNVIRPFRAMKPYSDMPKAEQTKAILNMIKSNAEMVEAIRTASAADTDVEGDQED